MQSNYKSICYYEGAVISVCTFKFNDGTVIYGEFDSGPCQFQDTFYNSEAIEETYEKPQSEFS